MKLLRTIFGEMLGLFVDDWVFALLLLLWVGLIAAFGPALFSAVWAGPALFAGLAVLVLVFVVHRARR